jgi:hypothetical protein
VCSVINHTPVCICSPGYTGDPFTNCFSSPPPRKSAKSICFYWSWLPVFEWELNTYTCLCICLWNLV